MRGPIRVAALSHIPVTYYFTHDSIGVGEDGPTHQPVETVSSLRLIPNLDVMRPGDAEETAGAYIHGMNRKGGPTALILSRQDLPVLTEMSAADKRAGTLKGAYTIVKETAELVDVLRGPRTLAARFEESELQEMARQVRLVKVDCGSTIYWPNEESDFFALVLHGEVAVFQGRKTDLRKSKFRAPIHEKLLD